MSNSPEDWPGILQPRKHAWTADRVKKWFEDALKPGEPRPSLEVCDGLAREFRRAINKAATRYFDQHGISSVRKNGKVLEVRRLDEDFGDILEGMVKRVIAAADQVLIAARELEDYAGGYVWGVEEPVSLVEVQEILIRIGATQLRYKESTKLGRPDEAWHHAAFWIALLIKKTMKELGQKKRLSLATEEGIPAVVGALAINFACGIKIKPRAFVRAVHKRDRRQADELTFEKIFPDAARFIKMP